MGISRAVLPLEGSQAPTRQHALCAVFCPDPSLKVPYYGSDRISWIPSAAAVSIIWVAVRAPKLKHHSGYGSHIMLN